MEGNFYVSSAAVSLEQQGVLSRAYNGCHEESEAYGRCVEIAHHNKELNIDSCKTQRAALRACIDKQVTTIRAADAAAKQLQQKGSSAPPIDNSGATPT